MKVYVVTAGSYSDYRIKGIFTTKKLAIGYMKLFKEGLYTDFNEVEDWDLDLLKTEIELGYTCFQIQMSKSGNLLNIRKTDFYWIDINYVPKDERFYGEVFANDEAHAIKIFNERRVQYIYKHNL